MKRLQDVDRGVGWSKDEIELEHRRNGGLEEVD